MKTLPRAIDMMRNMCSFISGAYSELSVKEKGTIQFCLHENSERVDCYIIADGNEMTFNEGTSAAHDVMLEASVSDWLALASKRINPVWGVITRKLRFTGEVSYFKKLIPADLYKVDLSPFSDPVTSFESSVQKSWLKPGKVLLIDSSPRGSGGYTKLYSDNIERFFKDKNIMIDHILLSRYKIQPCRGCLHCWLKSGGDCIYKDDVKELYDQYEEADLIVYAFPLYAYGVPGILKNFIDRGVMRQYPYFEKGISEIRHPRRIRKDKSMMVFSICGFPGFHQFDSVKQLFKLYSNSSHTPLVAEIYRPGAVFLLQNPFNYIKFKKFLDALRLSVYEVIECGRISPGTKRKLNFLIDQKAFLKSTNKYWDNLYKAMNADY